MDAAEYKHIVLGLVFLKYVSDAFEERQAELRTLFEDSSSDKFKKDPVRREAALNERDNYTEVNVFWVPEKARWSLIQQNSKQSDIAVIIDNALYEVEKENKKLQGIVQRKYAEASIEVADLGGVVDLVGAINFGKGRLQASDVLGEVYEYFLGKFANEEGKNGGQFYTTPSIVRTLVEILQPTSGRVYDPCCGSGGMFVHSERFVEAHGGKIGNISIYGQESNPTTRRLAAMNLAIRGIDYDLGNTNADTFTNDIHRDKKFDFVLMNPPFGRKESYPKAQLLNDVRWQKYGVPREKPANYAWISHALHHLAPKGRAGIVMARGTLTSNQGGDDVLRQAFLDDDIVECIVDLPPQLFFNTQIPSCLWFFNKDKSKWKNDRTNEVLFIDARKLGSAVSKTQIEFSDSEIERIAKAFHDWTSGQYINEEGFSATATIEEIKKNRISLSPARYIGTEEVEDIADEDFESQVELHAASLLDSFSRSTELEKKIKASLKALGYGD